MTRWQRELDAIVRAFTPNYQIARTRNGHFKVTISGPKGREVAYCGGVLKDAHAIKNIRSDIRRRAVAVGALAS